MDVKHSSTGRPGLETGIEPAVTCWCGGSDFDPLGSDYLRCHDCGTVVYGSPVDAASYTAADGTGFYGDRYWRRHVPRVLGLPGLEARARSDLPERAVFHLVKILDLLAPGGRVLELGCGAGSLTYLLRQAGFDAEGLELGPAAIEVARERFGLEVRRGPLEALDAGERYDAIVAVDVLEHLPAPLATLSGCARRLAADGLLFAQTPCYRDQGADWEMLLPEEHLHLFTEASAARLLRAAGFATVDVGRSLFPHDMWLTASPAGRPARRPDPLAGVPPLVVALIDSYAEGTRARAERDAVDADRRRKERLVERLRDELEAARGDQRAKEKLVGRQDRELRRIRGDQRAKSELIARLDADLKAARHDQAAKAELIESAGAELESVREDQQRKSALIDRMSSELGSARQDQAAKEELIDGVSSELESARQDQAAKEELIGRIAAELETVRADQQAKERVIQRLDADLGQASADFGQAAAELEEIRADRLYRLLRALRAGFGARR